MNRILSIFIIFFTLSCQEHQDSSSIDSCSVKIDSLQASIDSLKIMNLDLQDKVIDMKTNENPIDLPYEAEFIKDKLRNSTSLIEMESVLGGSMYFSDIKILNKKWILASYEDGHVQGVSLIQYRSAPDSSIKFVILDSIEHY